MLQENSLVAKGKASILQLWSLLHDTSTSGKSSRCTPTGDMQKMEGAETEKHGKGLPKDQRQQVAEFWKVGLLSLGTPRTMKG